MSSQIVRSQGETAQMVQDQEGDVMAAEWRDRKAEREWFGGGRGSERFEAGYGGIDSDESSSSGW